MTLCASINRLSLMGESPNTLACWIGLLFFLTYCHLSKRPGFRLAICGGLLLIIALTQSRSAILLAFLVWTMIFSIDRKRRTLPGRGVISCICLAGFLALCFIGCNGRWGSGSLQKSFDLRSNITKAALIRAAEKNFLDDAPIHGLAYDAHIRYGLPFSREQIHLITRPLSSVLQLLTEQPRFWGAAACAVLFAPAIALFFWWLQPPDEIKNFAIPASVSFFVGCAFFNDLNQDYSGRLLSVLMLLLSLCWLFWPTNRRRTAQRALSASAGVAVVLSLLLYGFLLVRKNHKERNIARWYSMKYERPEGTAYYLAGRAATLGHLLILDYGVSEELSLKCVADGCHLLGAGWGLLHVESPIGLQDFYLHQLKDKALIVIALGGGIPKKLKRIAGKNDKFIMINPQEVNAISELADERVSFIFTEAAISTGSETIFYGVENRVTPILDLLPALIYFSKPPEPRSQNP